MKKSILKYFKAFTMIGVMASVAILSSCGEDDGGEPAATLTAYGILSAESNLGKLKSEIDVYSSLVDVLSNESADLTVFAPSDAAMSALLGTLGLESFATVSAGIAQSVLSYHVSTAGALTTGELTEGMTVMTAQGEVITIGAGTKLVTGATAESTITNTIQATNGIVHIVDVVIIPPTIGGTIVATLGTLAQPVLLGADFSILASGIAKADAANDGSTPTIIETLIGGENLTVFAPTNGTFNAGGLTVDSFDAATWNAIIRNHVVVAQGGEDGTGTIGTDELSTAGFSATSAVGIPLGFVFTGTPSETVAAINPAAPGVFIDGNADFDGTDLTKLDAEIVVVDAAVAANGRIHVIAGVLAPQ
ncbi:MAG: fasciclin domain-containing protein [Ekhidna sp.]